MIGKTIFIIATFANQKLLNVQVGNGALNIEESRTHFSLWAAMKAPLILGNDLTHMSDTIYDILTNRKVISVNVRANLLALIRVRSIY